ncbi:ABC transporter permease [Roseomonas haemaphysalidis]|uniref:ABC transporter permease n=1 Tax=Roseomonas haemaphysalidis TaxID=2768162 RepID=UPI001F251377|nr:ABC transporter permease [Roseomonas haemaphysalidis]
MRDPALRLGCLLAAVLALCAVAGPWLVPFDPLATDTPRALQPPSAAHWFGTDQLGRDVLSRCVAATRLDLGIAGAAVLLSLAAGGVAGAAMGQAGGWADALGGRLAEVLMAFPLFVLALALVAALGPSVGVLVGATALVNLPLYLRLARAEAAVRRHAGFVEAARMGGAGPWRVLLGVLLPNILPVLVVQAAGNLGWAVLNAAGLSFLGLGVRPPAPEWGLMVAEGAPLLLSGGWWVAGFPALALVLAVLCFTLLGDALRDRLDPRGRR